MYPAQITYELTMSPARASDDEACLSAGRPCSKRGDIPLMTREVSRLRPPTLGHEQPLVSVSPVLQGARLSVESAVARTPTALRATRHMASVPISMASGHEAA